MTEYDVDAALKKIFDNSDGKDTNWKPSDIIPVIEKEIEFLKDDLIDFFDTSDYNFPEILKEAKTIYETGLELTEEMNWFRQEIEEVTMIEMVKSLQSHRALHRELEKVNYAISTTSQAVICGKFIKEFEEGRENQSYRQAMEAVYDLVVLLENPSEGFSQLDLYSNAKSSAQLILDSLLIDLNAEWIQLVTYATTTGKQKSLTSIILNLDPSPLCYDVLTALDKCKKLKEKVAEFSQFLLKDVFIPIVNSDCTVYAETEQLINLTVYHKADFKPPYTDVISNFRLCFAFLSNKFNYQYGSLEICLMNLIGEELREEFCKMLVKDCFIDTIPSNLTDLQSYGKVTSEIKEFQNLLLSIKFFDEDVSLLNYVNDMDQLFADKSSQYFLETARSILVKDLSDTMSIGLETIPDDTGEIDVALDENTEEALNVLKRTIPKSLFYFPRCMISKSAQELLDLVYILMEQAVQCPDVVSEKLYTTARLIFELYDAVVPYHHENYMMNIPQYVALFHNNCMYLAHNLQTFGDKWLTQLEGHVPEYPIGFTDLVPRLRDLGQKHLTLHLQHQRTQILDSIRNSDLNSIGQKDSLGDSAEVAVRQCLRQLQILKNVWIGVFPPNVFAKVMGTLVELAVSALCLRVCAAEDIPAAAASQLAGLYTRVLQRVPQLFQNATDVDLHVSSWCKLQQVVLVLEGSLKDIEAAWRGSLLGSLAPNELRSLVKALFQNTHARAQLLQQIH